MSVNYYDRHGQLLPDQLAWGKLATDLAYKRVAETTLANGRWVSTVWLGRDPQFGEGPPLIFETIVFPKEGEWSKLDSDRYSTEAEAMAGHAVLCAKWELEL